MSTFALSSTRRLVRCAAAIFALAAAASSVAQTTISTGGVEVRGFLALTASNVYAATHGGGLWRSTDGSGSTWTRIALNAANERYLTSIAGTSSLVILGAEEGLLRSTNGTTFTRVLYEPVSAVAVSSTTVLAAIKGVGIMRSTDSGATFTQATNTAFDSKDMTALAFHPSNANVAYAASKPDGNGAGGGVFTSSDGGSTWTSHNANLTATQKYVTSLEVTSDGTVYMGFLTPANVGTGYYRPSGGGSWISCNFGGAGDSYGGVVSLHRDINGSTIWGGGRTLGLQVGSNSSFNYTFSAPAQPNLFFTAINAVVTLPGTSTVLKAIKGAGVWRGTNGTSTTSWTRVDTFTGADRVLSAGSVGSSSTSLLAGLVAGGVWRSTNSGSSWTAPTISASQADFSFSASFTGVSPFVSIWEIAASPTNANLAYAASGGVGMFYGNDTPGLFRWNGSQWQGIGGSAAGAPYNRVAESGFFEGTQIYGVALNRADESVAYASFLASFAGFERRSGSSWVNMNPPGTTTTIQMRGVVTSATTTRLIALPFDDKPIVSTDSGTSWSVTSVSQTGFERIRFFAAAENPAAPTQWLGGTNKGLFYSGDSGGSWTRASMASVFAQLPISAVGFNASGKAFAADFDGNRYCSGNGGVTWVSAGTKLNAGVNAMRLVAGKLYYLTDGAGLVREDGTC